MQLWLSILWRFGKICGPSRHRARRKGFCSCVQGLSPTKFSIELLTCLGKKYSKCGPFGVPAVQFWGCIKSESMACCLEYSGQILTKGATSMRPYERDRKTAMSESPWSHSGSHIGRASEIPSHIQPAISLRLAAPAAANRGPCTTRRSCGPKMAPRSALRCWSTKPNWMPPPDGDTRPYSSPPGAVMARPQSRGISGG